MLDRLRRAVAQPTPLVAEAWRAALAIPVLGALLRRLAGPPAPAS
jgi:hypothetical protein